MRKITSIITISCFLLTGMAFLTPPVAGHATITLAKAVKGTPHAKGHKRAPKAPKAASGTSGQAA